MIASKSCPRGYYSCADNNVTTTDTTTDTTTATTATSTAITTATTRAHRGVGRDAGCALGGGVKDVARALRRGKGDGGGQPGAGGECGGHGTGDYYYAVAGWSSCGASWKVALSTIRLLYIVTNGLKSLGFLPSRGNQKSRGKKGGKVLIRSPNGRTFEYQTSQEFSLGVSRLCRESPMEVSGYPLRSLRASLLRAMKMTKRTKHVVATITLLAHSDTNPHAARLHAHTPARLERAAARYGGIAGYRPRSREGSFPRRRDTLAVLGASRSSSRC